MSRNDAQANILNYGANAGTVLGHYRTVATCALVPSQAAASILWAVRWSDATRLMVVERIDVQVFQTAVSTTGAAHAIGVQVCRAFTVADSAGVSLLPAGNTAKMRTSPMNTTLVNDLRVSTVAAGLTAGTRTPDANPILVAPFTTAATTINPGVPPTASFEPDDSRHPLVLAQNEGLEGYLIVGLSGPSDGASAYFTLEWAEVEVY